jgi:hypothetical protein
MRSGHSAGNRQESSEHMHDIAGTYCRSGVESLAFLLKDMLPLESFSITRQIHSSSEDNSKKSGVEIMAVRAHRSQQ